MGAVIIHTNIVLIEYLMYNECIVFRMWEDDIKCMKTIHQRATEGLINHVILIGISEMK